MAQINDVEGDTQGEKMELFVINVFAILILTLKAIIFEIFN